MTFSMFNFKIQNKKVPKWVTKNAKIGNKNASLFFKHALNLLLKSGVLDTKTILLAFSRQ